MDEKRKDPGQMVDKWLGEILDKNDISSNLNDPAPVVAPQAEEAELERIVQQTLAENWGDMPQMETDPEPQEEALPLPDEESNTEEIDEADAPQVSLLRKMRPKAQKGYGLFGIPHILATCMWILLIVAIGTSLGRTVWLCAADLLALGKEGQQVTITIEVQDRLPDIAEKLKNAGMIRYPNLFESFAKLTGKGDGIMVGSITFSEKQVYDYNALINAMSFRGGSVITLDVLIPEGYSCAQIFALLEEKGICPASELEEYAANGELEDYWFLEDVTRGHKYCLEGFLFPDTYNFYLNSAPGEVITKLLEGFSYRFDNEMLQKFAQLNTKLEAKGVHLTTRQMVTMSSIIEKEKANAVEGYDIASVFYNRLTNPGSFPHLQSDATILYATEYYNAGELTTQEAIDISPYNTYTQKGLPAGPIANPGLDSLKAALEPSETDYFFFIFDKSAGVHRFSRTLSEHESWASRLGI